jgi:[ribosomal protein S5]-alanine N-acetyltransferase
MIVGKKIRIRLVRQEDLKGLIPLLQASVYRFDGFIDKLEPEHILYDKFQKHGFWEEGFGMMLIVDRRENILGALLYRSSNVSYSIDVKYAIFDEADRGQGYMKEALSLFSAYLFSTKQTNRLQLSIPDYHRASIAVGQKCGYKFEGIARGAAFSKGKYIDLCIYSMLREESKTIESLCEK